MISQKTNKKIQEIQEKIVRDFSEACGDLYVLPIEFSKPQRVTANNYRVSADVVEAAGKYYPVGVFSGNVYDCINGKVAVLNGEYDSLGTAFGIPDGGFLFGIRVPVSHAKTIDDISEKMFFDLDLKNSDYTLFEGLENQNQKGND